MFLAYLFRIDTSRTQQDLFYNISYGTTNTKATTDSSCSGAEKKTPHILVARYLFVYYIQIIHKH